MTAVDERPVVVCPPWCHQGSPEYPCSGEHYSEARYIAATAGLPVETDPHHGATFPLVGVAVVFSQHPHSTDQAPFVSISTTGVNRDLDLRVPEARELIRLLQEAVDTIG